MPLQYVSASGAARDTAGGCAFLRIKLEVYLLFAMVQAPSKPKHSSVCALRPHRCQRRQLSRWLHLTQLLGARERGHSTDGDARQYDCQSGESYG